jgi:hypothetical protein
MAIVQGILRIVSVIAVMQLWLFTATMEAYLGGDQSFGLSAALASMMCLGLNLGLLHRKIRGLVILLTFILATSCEVFGEGEEKHFVFSVCSCLKDSSFEIQFPK